MKADTGERGATMVDAVAAVFLAVVCTGLLLSTTGCPAFSRARESARMVQCANNLRTLGLGVLQYAERYAGQMPTAYENLWNRVAPYLGDAVWPPKEPTGGPVFRCPSDEFVASQAPWGEQNQCSYAPNADETGAGTLKPEDEAGWSRVIAGGTYGAQYSPFTAKYKDCPKDEQAVAKLSAVATDTVLLAECWRANTQNSLFLDSPQMKMRETAGVPVVGTRNSLLLKQYTSTAGVTLSAKGRLSDAGPFSFLLDYTGAGGSKSTALEDTYHLGRMNVLYADGHTEVKEVAELASGPGQGKWANMKKIADIPYWNKVED